NMNHGICYVQHSFSSDYMFFIVIFFVLFMELDDLLLFYFIYASMAYLMHVPNPCTCLKYFSFLPGLFETFQKIYINFLKTTGSLDILLIQEYESCFASDYMFFIGMYELILFMELDDLFFLPGLVGFIVAFFLLWLHTSVNA
ncbi:hypothetical protein ACJX0J_032950, partial [Zea mays]